MKVGLREVAFARSGDKGDTANIGVIAIGEIAYPHLVEQLTADTVKRYFRAVCRGSVERYELPNLCALNFLLHESLGGGGTVSLMLDAQGKTFAAGILGLEIDVPKTVIDECRQISAGNLPGRGRGAPGSVR
ncbi:MAG: hypothetical protein OEM23_02755 [Gemmatimonadota bacterium]|nr:hypothetical protein [Gemmatimonadota bacterium]MDH3427332.1 hypothetical protein [Gemmatimonadota bacterium]